MVLKRYRAAIFVHGCFWHGHDCPLFRLPETRSDFWAAKIQKNKERDIEVAKQLSDAGWRQLTVWECAIRGPGRLGLGETVHRVVTWLPELFTLTADIRAPAAV
jgi:DNA mismatch endonuclease (patch repair protein)